MSLDASDITPYLEGAEFPATGGALAGVAAGNDAPAALIEALRQYEGEHFDAMSAVVQTLTESR